MQKEYLLIRRQYSSGCDYTIGCGVTVTRISASSLEDALQKLIKLPEDWKQQLENAKDQDQRERILESLVSGQSNFLIDTDDSSERFCAEIDLYEVSSSSNVFPILQGKLKEIRDFEKELQQKEVDEIERKQFERLKKKFEKNISK